MGGSRADSLALVSLGCRVGRADAGSIAAALPDGFRAAAPGEAADWVVVSTCSVTADAASTSRQAVRRAAREHPGARIVVAGCHVEQEGELLAALPGVSAVVGPGTTGRSPACWRGCGPGRTPGRRSPWRGDPRPAGMPRRGRGPVRPAR